MLRSLVIAVFGLAAAAAARPAPAAADGCISPGFQLLSPTGPAEVPRNVRVRVTYDAGGAGQVAFALRAGAAEVPVTTRRFVAGPRALAELTPVAPLAAGTRYEVVAREALGARTVTTVVGQLVAGDFVDQSSPRWAHRRGVAGAADDVAAPSNLLYAVWRADRAGRFDTDRPPLALLPMSAGGLAFAGGRCAPIGLELPRGRHVLSVTAVDEAGNRSPPRRVTVRRR